MCTTASKKTSGSGCGGKCGDNCPGAIARAAATARAAAQSGTQTIAKTSAIDMAVPVSRAETASSPQPRAGELHEPGTSTRPSLDKVTTFGASGSRVMLYPAHVSGVYYKLRGLAGLLLITVYLALPWIQIGGAPAVFFNLAERRIHLFGLTFLTQDLWLAFFIVTGVGFALFTITAIWGRIWCGWACPLTVFLDVVRKVERWIEGDGLKRKRLDSEPWSFGIYARRILKHGVVGAIAAIVAHGFLAYFVSIPALFKMMREAPAAHPGAFLLMTGTTAALWFCFAWFKEQFCIVLCPYGRLQSVLTDEHTLVVGYDTQRGEPRGRSAAGSTHAGDCVDCGKCVQVCPTGIDIRQGLQLECIGCAACIDACDTVMDKLRRPRGLVRYDSLAHFKGQPKRFWRPRLVLYSVLLALGIVVGTFAVSSLRNAVVSLTRLTGAPYFVQDGVLRNQFLLRVLNKQPHANWFSLKIEGELPDGLVLQGDLHHEEVASWGETQQVIVLTLPLAGWHRDKPLYLVVRDAQGSVLARKPFTLLGPDAEAHARWVPADTALKKPHS